MKKRNTKKGEFVCRRQKPSDKSFSLKESYRLAYFEVMNRPAYIIRKRKINNVIYVGRDRVHALGNIIDGALKGKLSSL